MRKNIVLVIISCCTQMCCDHATSPTPHVVNPYTPRPLVMKEIPAGTYYMGATTQLERPIHLVTLSAFAMQETEVTQGQYSEIMGINPSNFNFSTSPSPASPVEEVAWYDAVVFCNKLSKKQNLDTVYRFTSVKDSIYTRITGKAFSHCAWLDSLQIDYAKKGYRLPTEAEWEYACRGGTTTIYWWGDNDADKGANAWCKGYSGWETHPVATKTKNAYGLYDMTGNVWEYCNDWNAHYDSTAQTNPTGPVVQLTYRKIIRGGSYSDGDNGELNSSFRNSTPPNGFEATVGFRVAITR